MSSSWRNIAQIHCRDFFTRDLPNAPSFCQSNWSSISPDLRRMSLPASLPFSLVFPASSQVPSFQKKFFCTKENYLHLLPKSRPPLSFLNPPLTHQVSINKSQPWSTDLGKPFQPPISGGLQPVLRSLPPYSWLFQGPWPSRCDAGFGPRPSPVKAWVVTSWGALLYSWVPETSVLGCLSLSNFRFFHTINDVKIISLRLSEFWWSFHFDNFMWGFYR